VTVAAPSRKDWNFTASEGSCEKIKGRAALLRVRLAESNANAEHRVPTK